MTDTRTAIATAIREHPGIHFNELVRTLDLAAGQVQYHIKHLCTENAIVTEHLYGRTHYYPPAYDQWEREALALLHRETAADIVVYLLIHGATPSGTVADDLDIARSTLEWQLNRLIDLDLVVKQRAQDGTVEITTDHSEDITWLLREADPTLRERLIDRFTRLVDALLTE